MMCRFDYDRAAMAIRMAISGRMLTQAKVVKECGLNRSWFNAFLRRRINLLDKDIESILNYLSIDQHSENLTEKLNGNDCTDS